MKGFSLLELMLVVAIIGILAAIAIPEYQRYIAMSQVTELVNLMKAATRSLEIDYLLHEQPLPDSLNETPIKTKGTYVERIFVSENKFLTGCLKKQQIHALIADSCLSVTYLKKDWWCVAVQIRGQKFALPVFLEMEKCVEQIKTLI